MPNLEANIFNQKLKLSFEENEKKRLINAIEELNKKWNQFSKLHGKVSDTKIITLISLELQDSIGDAKSLKDELILQKSNIRSLKEEIKLKKIESEENFKIINKFKLQLEEKNEEISKVERILDEINNELLEIKKNILTNNNE